MDKDDLLRCAHAEASRIIEESPDKWAAKSYPLRYETEFEGREISVDVSVQQFEKDHSLCVSAYESRRDAGWPTSSCALIPLNKALRFLSRAEATLHARSIASQIESESYTEWAAKDFPVTYERSFEGHHMRIEITALGSKTDQLVLRVAVDNGGILAYSPATAPAFISRPKATG